MAKLKLKVAFVLLVLFVNSCLSYTPTESSEGDSNDFKSVNRSLKSLKDLKTLRSSKSLKTDQSSSSNSTSVERKSSITKSEENSVPTSRLKSDEKIHGPNPGPTPIRTPKSSNLQNLRSRFPIFPKNKKSGEIGTEARVKIVEALNAPRLDKTPPEEKQEKDKISKDKAQTRETSDEEEELTESDEKFSEEEALHDPSIFSKRSGVVYGGYNPNLKPPPPPPPPMSNNYGGGYGSNNHYGGGGGGGGGWNRPNPPPSYIGYKPTGGGGGLFTTMSPIVFPPIGGGGTTENIIGPEITPEGPEPEGPVGPTGAVVPIIGGGGSGTGGTDEDEDALPPSPPDEDIFPPSPPEIEGVSRALPLKATPTRARAKLTGGSREATRTRVSTVGSPGSTGGQNRVRMKLRDKLRDSLESSHEPKSLGDVDDANVITDFVFSDIRCLKTRSREYFGATIHMKSGYHPPYVRDRPQDPLTSSDCRMETVPGSINTFQMRVTDLRGCGVEQCGDHMCLTMVFPRVPTLALADDEVTTIKCLPQKSSMADTRTISFAGDALDNRRSSSTVEGGGQEFAAEVGVFRQSPGAANAAFSKRVNSGGVVQLGEPLQLRSIVRGGDGWKHSKLSDVKVWRMRDVPAGRSLDNLDPKDASEVITLVDGTGCRNNEYEVIAERHPLKDPRNDLINHFTFKAFLFRGQRTNEPLVLTAKVHACQEDVDCVPRHCNSNSRRRRSPVEIQNSSAIVHNYDSQFSLRVVGLKDHPASLTEEDFGSASGRSFGDSTMTCTEKMATAGLGGGLIVLLLCSVGFGLFAFVLKGRKRQRPSPFKIPSLIESGLVPSNSNPSFNPAGGRPFTTRVNKPLPPPPPPDHHQQNPSDQISKNDVANVAKLLKQLKHGDGKKDSNSKNKSNKKAEQQGRGGKSISEGDQTEYECIDEGDDSSEDSKKSDGVYIVYIDKDGRSGGRKSFRPKSAPPSLRGKGRAGSTKKKRKKLYVESTEDDLTPTEDSEDLTTTDDSSDGQRSPKGVKCVGFGSRRTVRNVKTRSNHHKVVLGGIRRRLSSLYNSNNSPKFVPSGSFPARQKDEGKQRGRHEVSPEIYKKCPAMSSSDLDSAYYGSEIGVNKEDHLLNDIRQVAERHKGERHAAVQRSQRNLQRRGGGAMSPPLLPGETKAAHFVTRNENSTQILIVPETHV